MEKTIKLPNAIWSRGLTAADFQMYLAIKTFTNRFGHCVVRHQTLATTAGVSVPTAARAIQRLVHAQLISTGKRFNSEGRLVANSYTLFAIPGGFTLVPANILQYRLPKSALKVYLYLLRCRDNNSLEAVPSLSQMVSALRMSKRTIVDAVSSLSGLLLLHKEHYQRKQDSRLGHNRYRVITNAVRRVLAVILAKFASKKEMRAALRNRATRRMEKVSHLYTTTIAPVVRKVKDFLCDRAFLFRCFIGTILTRQ